jgi:hypothetical protein
MNSTALEKHYRVSELAKLWGFCPGTVIKLFSDEPGVLKLQGPSGKRKYTTLSIPESVASRVHERLSRRSPPDEASLRQPNSRSAPP